MVSDGKTDLSASGNVDGDIDMCYLSADLQLAIHS
jgi:hypothetical protein